MDLSPQLTRPRSDAVRYGLTLVLMVLITILSRLSEDWLSLAGLSMLYLLGVVVAAVYLGRYPGALTAVLSVVTLNFFFTPPRLTFRIANPDHMLELAALLVVSLVIGELVHRLQVSIQAGREREHRLRVLYQLSRALEQADADSAVRLGVEHLHLALHRSCALFLPDAAGAPKCSWVEPEGDEFRYDSRAVAWVMEHQRPLGPFTRNWPELGYWGVSLAGGGALFLATCSDAMPSGEDLSDMENFGQLIGLALQREEAQDQARLARLKAETEALRNTLLASLSHDVRTPLAVILGAAGALRTEDATLDPQHRAALLAMVEDEAQAMSRTAENVLQLARVNASGFTPRLDWESLEEVVGAVVARLRKRHPEARIHLHLARDLPLARLDASLLAQVCANLLENALRHGGGTPVDVAAEARHGELRLAVKDRGPGFPPAGDEQGRGDGLGLKVCEAIAQAHGGRLERRGRTGGGGEIRLVLPLSDPPSAPPEATP